MSINSQNIGKIKDIVRHVNSKIREEHNAMKKRVLDKIRAERKMDIKKAREQLNEKLKSKLISIGRKNREQLITDLNKHRKHWPTIKEPKKIVKSEKQPPKPDDKPKAPPRTKFGIKKNNPIIDLKKKAAPKAAAPKAAAPKPALKKPFDCSKCDKGSYTKVCVKCMKKDLAKAQKTTDETKVQYVTKKIKGTIRRIPVKKLDDAEKKKQLKKQLEPKKKDPKLSKPFINRVLEDLRKDLRGPSSVKETIMGGNMVNEVLAKEYSKKIQNYIDSVKTAKKELAPFLDNKLTRNAFETFEGYIKNFPTPAKALTIRQAKKQSLIDREEKDEKDRQKKSKAEHKQIIEENPKLKKQKEDRDKMKKSTLTRADIIGTPRSFMAGNKSFGYDELEYITENFATYNNSELKKIYLNLVDAFKLLQNLTRQNGGEYYMKLLKDKNFEFQSFLEFHNDLVKVFDKVSNKLNDKSFNRKKVTEDIKDKVEFNKKILKQQEKGIDNIKGSLPEPKAVAPKAAAPKAAAPKAAPHKAKPSTPAKKVDNDKEAFRAKQKEKNAKRREKEYKASYDDLPKSYKDIMDKLKEANLKPKTLKIVQPIYDEAIKIRNAMDKKKNEGNATPAAIGIVQVMMTDVGTLLVEMFNQTLKNKATLSTPIIKQAKEKIKQSQEALGTAAPKAAAPKAAAPKAAAPKAAPPKKKIDKKKIIDKMSDSMINAIHAILENEDLPLSDYDKFIDNAIEDADEAIIDLGYIKPGSQSTGGYGRGEISEEGNKLFKEGIKQAISETKKYFDDKIKKRKKAAPSKATPPKAAAPKAAPKAAAPKKKVIVLTPEQIIELKKLKKELKSKGVSSMVLKFIKTVQAAKDKLEELDDGEEDDKSVKVNPIFFKKTFPKDKKEVTRLVGIILPRNEYTLQDQRDYFDDLEELADEWLNSAAPRLKYQNKFDPAEKSLFKLLYPKLFVAQEKADKEAAKEEKKKTKKNEK